MSGKQIILAVGIISLLISISTWGIDLLGWVEECIYCRSERTIIGILGVIILLPIWKYITTFLTSVIGFFGAHISSEQVFAHIQSNSLDLMMALAACALFIIIGQVLFILKRSLPEAPTEPRKTKTKP